MNLLRQSVVQAGSTRCIRWFGCFQNTTITNQLHLYSTQNKPIEKSIHPKETNNKIIRKWGTPMSVVKNSPNWLMTTLLKTGRVAESRGQLIYFNKNSVEYMDFVTKFNMRDEFHSWFLITELHSWMLMVRAMAEEGHPVRIRDGISNVFWDDILRRAKALTTGKEVSAHMYEFSGQFQYAILSYDEGLSDDKVLASAIWNRFFFKKCENYEHIELLVKYIRINLMTLDKMTSHEFVKGRDVKWVTLDECALL